MCLCILRICGNMKNPRARIASEKMTIEYVLGPDYKILPTETQNL